MTSNRGITRRTALATGAAGAAALLMPNVLRAQQLTPIGVSVALRIANYLPVWVADRKGIFAKHGLKADINAAASIAEPVSILNAERAQFAITGTGMAVNSTVEGARMKVVAKLAGAIGLWAIGRPGTKIASLEDFKGKSIASLRFPSNTVSSPTYAMKSVGKFDPAKENVRFIEGPPGSIIPAVRDGRADVGCVFEWDASIAEQQGLQVLFSFVEVLGPIAFTSAMVKEDYAKKNPKIVQSFCNALAESMKLIRDDAKIYAEVAGQEFAQVPPAAIQAGTRRLLDAPGVVPLNPVVSKAEWDAIVAHELGAGTMRKALPFEEIVDNSFATKAAAEFGAKG
jgi:NitT/TauT family transport system substrate-binding protein